MLRCTVADSDPLVDVGDVSRSEVEQAYEDRGQNDGGQCPALDEVVKGQHEGIEADVSLKQRVGGAKLRTVQELLNHLPLSAGISRQDRRQEEEHHAGGDKNGLTVDLHVAGHHLRRDSWKLPGGTRHLEAADVTASNRDQDVQAAKEQKQEKTGKPQPELREQNRGIDLEVGKLLEPQHIHPDTRPHEKHDEQ